MNRWWQRLFGGLAAAGLALAALPRAGAESFPLELKRLDPADRSAGGDTWSQVLHRVMPQHFYMRLDEPEGRVHSQASQEKFSDLVKKQPEKYNSKRPLRAVARLGSQKFAFVLDDQKPDSCRYDRLWFDKNHNGDLTDEEPIHAKQSRGRPNQYSQSTFPRIDLSIEADGTKLDYAFSYSVYAYNIEKGSGQVSVSLNACAYREGHIMVDGKKHHILVVDFNSNGRFGDQARIRENAGTTNEEVYSEIGDMLFVDPSQERMGYAYYYPSAGPMSQYVSKLVNIEGKFYEVSLSPAGDKITLSPSSLPLGRVTNPSGPFHAIVYGEHGFVKISGDGKAPVPLPEGQWKLQAYTIDQTEYPKREDDPQREIASLLKKLVDLIGGAPLSSGPRYTVVTADAISGYKPVKVTKDQTVVLPFGPPYKPVVKVGYAQGNGKLQLEMSLVGSTGEICQEMRVEGQRPGIPAFTITNPKGEVVASGQFEYG